MEVDYCGWNIVKEEVPKVEEEQQQQEQLSKVLEVEAIWFGRGWCFVVVMISV